MILRECSCQLPETLEEHFSALNRKHVNGQGTLALIEALKEMPDDRVVYGLTCVDQLCLLSQDDHTTPWWVVVTSHGSQDFRIECLMPEDQAPWPGAHILGKTERLQRAVDMVKKGLEISGAWDN